MDGSIIECSEMLALQSVNVDWWSLVVLNIAWLSRVTFDESRKKVRERILGNVMEENTSKRE